MIQSDAAEAIDREPRHGPSSCRGSLPQILCQSMVAATLFIAAIALVMPLVSLGGWMLGREYYQHFPLLLIAAVGLAAARIREEVPTYLGLTSMRVLFWTFVAVGLTTVVFALPSRWMASVGSIAALVAFVNFYGGRDFAKQMIGPLLLIAAAIPLPVDFDLAFVVGLQQLATWLASVWLDSVNVLHVTTGVAIETAEQEYRVKDACSGIHSVFAALGVGFGYGAFRRYTLPRAVACVVQLLFWVVIANALRVFLTVYGQSKLGLDLSGDAVHEMLGLSTFAAAIMLGLSGDYLLRYIQPLATADEEWPVTVWEELKKSLSSRLDGRVPPLFAAAVTGSVMLSCTLVGWTQYSYTAEVKSPMSMQQMAKTAVFDLQELEEDFLPTELAGWRRSGFQKEGRKPDDPFGGMVGLVWQYSKGDRSLLLSLDGPYSDWHDLSVCYRGVGWDVRGMETVEAGAADQAFVAAQLMLERQSLESAHVLFGCVDPAGRDVQPPRYLGGTQYLGGTLTKLAGRLSLGMRDRPELSGGVVQLQLLHQSVETIDGEAKEENLQLFRAALRHAFPEKHGAP